MTIPHNTVETTIPLNIPIFSFTDNELSSLFSMFTLNLLFYHNHSVTSKWSFSPEVSHQISDFFS